MDFENVDLIEDFDKWKETLKRAVNISKAMGMSEDTITNIAKRIGDFLEDRVDPENREQRLLKHLWEAASPEERHTLAHIIVKMVD
jgi:Protein of unknown function (DUF3243)